MMSLKNQRGISLLETMVATAIFLSAVLGSVKIIGGMLEDIRTARKLSVRERVITNLVNYAGMPAALRASAIPLLASEPFNEPFKDCALDQFRANMCVTGNAPPGNPTVYQGFRLYLPVVEQLPTFTGPYQDMRTSGAITGVPAFPMRYNESGDMCDTSVSGCDPEKYPVEAFTEFMPFCKPNFIMALHGIHNLAWSGPIYPPAAGLPDSQNGLAYYPTCWGARYFKVRLTVRPSDPLNSNLKTLQFRLYVDRALFSRQ